MKNINNHGRLRPQPKSRFAGQALITLLFFSIIATTVTFAAVIVIITQAKTASSVDLSNKAYYMAESGVENALLQLLRNQSYTGEQLSIENGIVTVLVSGTNPKIITSMATASGYLRQVQAQVDYTNNVLTVLSWKETE